MVSQPPARLARLHQIYNDLVLVFELNVVNDGHVFSAARGKMPAPV